MRKIKVLWIGISCLVVFALILLYVFITPYKIMRTLPKISSSQVERVISWESRDTKKDLLEAGTFDIDRLIAWYNQAKELKTDIGTTSDCAIEIHLKNNSKITIWTLYSQEWVTIGYKREDESYYQTNVSSKDLASFMDNIRQNAGLE
jgi:hypothetical protein